MIVKTEHNINDEVFLMVENQVKEAYVNRIYTNTTKGGTEIKYVVVTQPYGHLIHRKEDQLFKTKEELLKSL